MYQIKPLRYNYNALEPFLSSKTVFTHYNSHYKKYLDNLNNLLLKNNYDFRYTLEDLVSNIDIFPIKDRGDILYNLGGVLNHEMYFEYLSNPSKVSGKLERDINKIYGSFENFKNEFIESTKSLVGSGYTFLVLNHENKLEIINTPNQDTPYSYGLKPIFNIDLWEHAYYLDYQNNRNQYVLNFFQNVDFNYISEEYEKI